MRTTVNGGMIDISIKISCPVNLVNFLPQFQERTSPEFGNNENQSDYFIISRYYVESIKFFQKMSFTANILRK